MYTKRPERPEKAIKVHDHKIYSTKIWTIGRSITVIAYTQEIHSWMEIERVLQQGVKFDISLKKQYWGIDICDCEME